MNLFGNHTNKVRMIKIVIKKERHIFGEQKRTIDRSKVPKHLHYLVDNLEGFDSLLQSYQPTTAGCN